MVLALFETGSDGLQHLKPCAPTGAVRDIDSSSILTESTSVNVFLSYCESLNIRIGEEDESQVDAKFSEWWGANQSWGFDNDREEIAAYTKALKVLQEHLTRPLTIVAENKKNIARILGLPIISHVVAFIERKRQERRTRSNAEAAMEESDVEELVFSHGQNPDDLDGNSDDEAPEIFLDEPKELVFPSRVLGITREEYYQWKASFAESGFDGTFSGWFQTHIMHIFASEGLDDEGAAELMQYLNHESAIEISDEQN